MKIEYCRAENLLSKDIRYLIFADRERLRDYTGDRIFLND